MPKKVTAENLMDEILIATVLKKEWNYKRVATFTVEKQIELIKEILEKIEHPVLQEKLIELQQIAQDIQKTKV